jgi:hypothetical protein
MVVVIAEVESVSLEYHAQALPFYREIRCHVVMKAVLVLVLQSYVQQFIKTY